MARTKRRPRYPLSSLHDRFQRTITDRIGLGIVLIWAVTFAPLYDGVFVTAVASGQFSTSDGIWPSVVFGAACFSGGGAIAGALTLTGTLRRRLISLLGVYLTIAAGAFAEIALLAGTVRQVPAHANVAGAFVLLVLAATMLRLQITLTPLSMLALLLALGGAIWLQEDTGAPPIGFDPGAALIGTSIALLVSFLMMTSVALLSSRLTRWLDPAWISRAGAASVGAIALGELGLPVPSGLTIGLLAGGALLPLLLRSRSVRRLRCWRRALQIYRRRTVIRIAGDEVVPVVPHGIPPAVIDVSADIPVPVNWARILTGMRESADRNTPPA